MIPSLENKFQAPASDVENLKIPIVGPKIKVVESIWSYQNLCEKGTNPMKKVQLDRANFMVDAQLSRLSSVFDSCFLCSIVFPWSKDSQCRNYGGKGKIVFVVAMN